MTVSDEALMAAFQKGDAASFEVLVDRFQLRLWRFAWRLTHSREAAEDIVQETFVRVVQVRRDWEPKAKVSSWLFTITRNLCMDFLRRGVHRRTTPLEQGVDSERPPVPEAQSQEMSPEHAPDAARFKDRLDALLRALPAEQREVFLLREMGGMGFSEIALATGATEPTVKSRMRYALEKLREGLQEFAPDTSAIGDSP